MSTQSAEIPIPPLRLDPDPPHDAAPQEPASTDARPPVERTERVPTPAEIFGSDEHMIWKSEAHSTPPVGLTGSEDELARLLSKSITPQVADPLLGSFDPAANPDVQVTPRVIGPGPDFTTTGNAPAPHATPPLDVDIAPAGSSELPNLTASPSSFDGMKAFIHATKPPARDSEDDDEEEDEGDRRGVSIGTLLLASYASAVTLGLAYVIFNGRSASRTDSDVYSVVDERPDPGRRADRSKTLEPLPAIAADHRVALGGTLAVGSLKVTPVDITVRPVALVRESVRDERRNEEGSALWLRLKLTNTADNLLFAPLDEAFVRERAPGVLDSLIKAPGGHTIEMFPLAVESEWSIEGQSFPDLKPGQTAELFVVSKTKALDDLGDDSSSRCVWRIRLRTGLNQTDVIGVEFTLALIKP